VHNNANNIGKGVLCASH